MKATENILVAVFLIQLLASGGFASPSCKNECFYDRQYSIADCSEAELDRLPSHHGCVAARVLDLSFNVITSLPNHSFLHYRHVVNLDISSNAITDVQPGSFSGLGKVVSIDLSQNNIAILPETIFYSVQDTIEQIHLDRNNLLTISEGTFSNLTKLSALFLGQNRLTDLSPNLFMDLSALLRIHLNSNQLTSIPNGLLEPLHHLKILDLSSNSIVEVSPNLFDIALCSETITLANNGLRSIPRPARNASLVGLQTLDIRNNRISDATNITYFINGTDKLLLDGNPFSCDCSFDDVRELIQRDETSRDACTWTCIHQVTWETVLAKDLAPEDTMCPVTTTTKRPTTKPTDDVMKTEVKPSKGNHVLWGQGEKMQWEQIPTVSHNFNFTHHTFISMLDGWAVPLVIVVVFVSLFVLTFFTVILAICLCQTNQRIEKLTEAIVQSRKTPTSIKKAISRIKDYSSPRRSSDNKTEMSDVETPRTTGNNRTSGGMKAKKLVVNLTENNLSEKESKIDKSFQTKSPPTEGTNGCRKRTPNKESKNTGYPHSEAKSPSKIGANGIRKRTPNKESKNTGYQNSEAKSPSNIGANGLRKRKPQNKNNKEIENNSSSEKPRKKLVFGGGADRDKENGNAEHSGEIDGLVHITENKLHDDENYTRENELNENFVKSPPSVQHKVTSTERVKTTTVEVLMGDSTDNSDQTSSNC
ncbi:uncharacterized protein [Apostichopus japonicus]|uniref:uncharacterized protein isoform X2 n=1 Tax=Stichopus japonicus TaxID=307972 RepID=UPI003AB85C22